MAELVKDRVNTAEPEKKAFRMPRKVKDLLIVYVKEYARRILDSKQEVDLINSFDEEKAARAAICSLSKSEKITKHEKELILSEEGREKVIEFFQEKLVVNYFMMARDISYYEAKSLLTDKGVDYFPETRGIKSERYHGRFKDYQATEKQIKYIKDLNADLIHEEELSGREASMIIKCINMPTRTKPAYYSYYIHN